jgi:hypothetical protein
METRRPWLLPALVLLVLACTFGCDPFSLPALFLYQDNREPPLLKKLASDDKKDVTVVVLTYSGLETRPEFLRADRDLGNLVVKHLRDGFKDNAEKVKVVNPSKVEEFKSNHPNWKQLDLAEVGSRFDADYVIVLEIGRLGMYKPNCFNQIYQGRAELTVSLQDVRHPDEDAEHRDLTIIYPSESAGGEMPTDEKSPQAFKAEFFTKIATQVAWQFTAHLTRDSRTCD